MAIFCVNNGLSYATLNAIPVAVWQLGSSGSPVVFEVSGEITDTGNNTIANSVQIFALIRAAVGEEFIGNNEVTCAKLINTGAATASGILRGNQDNDEITFENLAFRFAGNTASIVTNSFREGQKTTLINCITSAIAGSNAATSSNVSGVASFGDNAANKSIITATNTIAAGFGGNGFSGTDSEASTICNLCTSLNNNLSNSAFRHGFNSAQANNCFSVHNVANGDDFNSLVAGSGNNASSDLTGDFTGYTTAELVDFAGGDYRISSASDLAGFGIGAFIETGGATDYVITCDAVADSHTALDAILIYAEPSTNYHITCDPINDIHTAGDATLIYVGSVTNYTITCSPITDSHIVGNVSFYRGYRITADHAIDTHTVGSVELIYQPNLGPFNYTITCQPVIDIHAAENVYLKYAPPSTPVDYGISGYGNNLQWRNSIFFRGR